MPAAAPWTPLRLHPGDSIGTSVTIGGTSRHQGLVVVHGDLVLHGTLQVDGLLVVTGSVDTRSGTLEVLGGVVASDDRGIESHIGGATRIAWSPCAMRRALAAVALPSAHPFALWSER